MTSHESRRIDPAELEVTLRVLAELSEIDEEDPDFLKVRHATAKMFKSVKVSRRAQKRNRIAEADRQVIAATATGAPTRIDDETKGSQLRSGTDAPSPANSRSPARATSASSATHSLTRSTTSSAQAAPR